MSPEARPSLTPLLICLVCALLPFLTVHGSYFIAASEGFVPWCNPYIDSCTSISATGRQAPASLLFRAGMLPSSVFIAGFWWLHWRWLQDDSGTSRAELAMLALGLLACVGLVLYVAVLGEIGDLWRLQRRIGTILFFSFTFLAQLLLAGQLLRRADAMHALAQATGRWMLRLCLLMLFIGICSVVVQALSEAWHDAIEDAMEWQLALLLQINFLLAARLWWRSPWKLALVRGRG
jgi:hypothetical protein